MGMMSFSVWAKEQKNRKYQIKGIAFFSDSIYKIIIPLRREKFKWQVSLCQLFIVQKNGHEVITNPYYIMNLSSWNISKDTGESAS